jgi:hypothetical protein
MSVSVTPSDFSPDQRRVRPNLPWNATFEAEGGYDYALDITDWEGEPKFAVTLVIDGKIYFKGQG